MILGERFEVGKLVGLGTAASVFRAHDRVRGDAAAVKVLHAAVVDSQDVVGRFDVECDLLTQFDHPHILAVRDRGIAGRLPWLATDYAPGRSLADRVLARRGVSLPALLGYVIDVLGALAYVHHRDVIHCDVKPENILIGAGERGLLVDFGIAHSPLRQRNAQGLALGTPAFCPPEQILDPGAVTRQTDVYAVGVTLFSSVTRQCGMALAVHTLRPRALAMLRPELAAIVDRATALDPADRFASADALAGALGGLHACPTEALPRL